MDKIKDAHRILMKQYHPDFRGSTYLASKINEAKSIISKYNAPNTPPRQYLFEWLPENL